MTLPMGNINKVYMILVKGVWKQIDLFVPPLPQLKGMQGYVILDESGRILKKSTIHA